VLYPVLWVLALAAVGGTYETAWLDRTCHAPLLGERLIDVGGH
jgi:hypothetical protein